MKYGMTHYIAVGNEIRDQDGLQIAVILPTNCTKKLASEMATYAAQHANHTYETIEAVPTADGVPVGQPKQEKPHG